MAASITAFGSAAEPPGTHAFRWCQTTRGAALRQVLRGRSYVERAAEKGQETETARELSDQEVARLVTGTFGLDVPEADVVRALPD